MHSLRFFCAIFFAMLAGFNQPGFSAETMITHVDPACAKHAQDELIETKVLEGILIGFVWGDYLHGEFVDKDGKPISLFIQTSDVSCFLAQYKGESLKVSYNKLCRYIPEGAGIYPVEEITQIDAETTNLISWRKGYNAARDSDTCERLEAKYTRKP